MSYLGKALTSPRPHRKRRPAQNRCELAQVAGVVAILGVGGLVVQRKSKPQASVDFGGDSMYDQQGFGASPGLPS